MTKMQELILICISEYEKENETMPTIRNIAEELNKSVSTIHYHLKRMKNIVSFNHKGKIIAICQK